MLNADIQCPSLYGFATLLLALASFMSRLSLNGTKMAAKQHQTHFLPIQQSPTKGLLPIPNDPGKQPRLKAVAELKFCALYENSHWAGLGSITSKTPRSEGVGSEERLVAKGNKMHCSLISGGDSGQTRLIKHRCPLRLARRMCQRAAFVFSALLSLAEKMGRERVNRRTWQRTDDSNIFYKYSHTHRPS